MRPEDFEVTAVDGAIELWCPDYGRGCAGEARHLGATLGEMLESACRHIEEKHTDQALSLQQQPHDPGEDE